MKKIISFTLIMRLLLSMLSGLTVNANTTKIWDGTYDTIWSGSGTSDDPYLISTAEELAGIAYKVNTGTTYSGKYFELTNDIYLNDISNYKNWSYAPPKNQWMPIGGHTSSTGKYNYDYYFAGEFNGNNKTVYGLYYYNLDSNYGTYIGLFGRTESSDIKNISIAKAYVCCYQNTGLLIGICGGGNIQNCKINNGIIKSSTHSSCGNIGGVIGKVDETTVTYCSFVGEISTETTYSCIGGIVGYATESIINKCYNAGNIVAASNKKTNNRMGGICGILFSYASGNPTYTISECYNSGTLKGDYNVGGICGEIHNVLSSTLKIENCYNTGSVSGYENVGGIVGQLYESWPDLSGYIIQIENCYNVGSVSGENSGGVVGKGYKIDVVKNTFVLESTCNKLYPSVSSATNVKFCTNSSLKQINTYSSWDFTNIWAIAENVNSGYPYLLWKQDDNISEQEQNTKFNPYHVSLSYPKKYLLFVDDTTLPGTPSQNKKEYIAELYEWAKEYGYSDVLTEEKATEIITKSMPTAVYADDSIALTADQYTTLEVMRDVIMLSSTKNSINQWENEYLINAGTINLTKTQEKIGKIMPEYSKYVKSVERNPLVTALYTIYSSKMVQLAGKSVYKVAKSHLKNNYVPDVLSEGGIEELYDMIIEDIAAWKDSGIASVSHIPAEVWEDIKSKSLKQIGKDAKKQLIKEIVSYNDSAQIMYDAYNTASSYAKGFKSTSLIAQFAPQILFQVQLLELGAEIMETISDVKSAQYFMINYYFKHNYPEVFDKIIDDNGNVIEYIDWITLINSSFNSSGFAENLMSNWYASNTSSVSDTTRLELMNLASTAASIQEQNINAMRKNIVEYWVNEINKENGVNIYQVQYSFNKADSFDIVDNNNTVLGSYTNAAGYNAISDDSYYNVSVDGETNAVVVTTLDPTIKVIAKKQTAPSVVTVVTSNDTIYSKSYANTEESENIIYSIQDGDINAADESGNTIVSEAEFTKSHSIVTLDKESLNIRYAANETSSSVCNNIELDNTGTYGSTITWYSSNEDVISTDGTITRLNKDVEVILTAKISYEDITISKEFKLTVLNNLITVTYDSCGGNEITKQNVVIGKIISLPDEPIRKGYYFEGWYYDSNYEYPFSKDNIASENITLYAKWTEKIYFDEAYCWQENEEYNYVYTTVSVSEKLQSLGGNIIVGLYDNNRLIATQIFTNNSSNIWCDFYEVPLSDNGYIIKVFCWSGLETLTPLCEVISTTVQQC